VYLNSYRHDFRRTHDLCSHTPGDQFRLHVTDLSRDRYRFRTKIFPVVQHPQAAHRRNLAKPQNPRRLQNPSASFSLQRFCEKLGHVF
jgi:hypothetical protein